MFVFLEKLGLVVSSNVLKFGLHMEMKRLFQFQLKENHLLLVFIINAGIFKLNNNLYFII